MFGYVVAHKSELKMREFHKYKAYYCGLCRMLREKYGFLGQLTLTYDMTFLIILLTSLYEPKTDAEEKRCIVHPMKKQKMLTNEIAEYAADMNIVLSYFHLKDDWQDEKSKKGYLGMKALKKAYRKLEKKYPDKCETIRTCLDSLQECEERAERDLDTVSRCFGDLMAELFVYKQDAWEETLRRVGFYLGKFIYLMDAYDDAEKDSRQQNYNVLIPMCDVEDFDERCREMLNAILAECTSAFELLPCVEDAEILRNILYAGVWTRFENKRLEKNQEKRKKYDSKSL